MTEIQEFKYGEKPIKAQRHGYHFEAYWDGEDCRELISGYQGLDDNAEEFEVITFQDGKVVEEIYTDLEKAKDELEKSKPLTLKITTDSYQLRWEGVHRTPRTGVYADSIESTPLKEFYRETADSDLEDDEWEELEDFLGTPEVKNNLSPNHNKWENFLKTEDKQ